MQAVDGLKTWRKSRGLYVECSIGSATSIRWYGSLAGPLEVVV
jgi:hypothetical protein